jgi:hypothetical protein
MNTKRVSIGLRWLPTIALGLLACLAPALGDDEDGHASRNCSTASLQGTYGFYRTGTGPFGPVADGVESDRFVVVDEGKGFYGVSVFEGITVHTVGTQIHARRGHGHRGNDDAR